MRIAERLPEFQATTDDRAIALELDLNDLRLAGEGGALNVATVECLEDVAGWEAAEWDRDIVLVMLRNREYMLVLPRDRRAPFMVVNGNEPSLRTPDPEKLSRLEVDGTRTVLAENCGDIFREGDRLVFSNAVPNDYVCHYQPIYTPKAPIGRPIRFYNEEGLVGQCGLHAVNSMVGKRFATPSAVTAFYERKFAGEAVARRLEDYAVTAPARATRADLANDPRMLADFLREAAERGELPSGFKDIAVEVFQPGAKSSRSAEEFQALLKNIPGDRIVLGSEESEHYFACRKYKGNWYKVDNMDMEQPVFQPADYIDPASDRQTTRIVIYLPGGVGEDPKRGIRV